MSELTERRDDDQRGIALIMVIVIIAMLIVIAVPFAMSMRMSLRGSKTYVDQSEARFAARGAVDRAIHDLYQTHDAVEASGAVKDYNTPSFDGETELLEAVTLPGMAAGRRVVYAARAEDEQGKVNINSASPWMLGNLIGSAILTENVDSGQTDIPVNGETAGPFFPAENGILWYHGELIGYRKFDGSTFLGCTRAMFGDLPEFADDGLKLREGTLIIDARAYLLAKLAYEHEPGQYHYFRTVDEMRMIAEKKADEDERGGLLSAVLSPQEFARIGPLLTVHSYRPSGEGWILEQTIQEDLPREIAPDSDKPERVKVDHPELYPPGSIVRLSGSSGTEYAMVLRVASNAKKDEGFILLNKQVTNEYTAGTATLALHAPHAININTAPPRIVYALFKGLGRNDRRVWPGNQAGGEPISPEEGLAMAEAVLNWRQAQGALRNFLDLKTCLDAIEEPDISNTKVNAAVINAMYRGLGLFSRTAPLTFRSGNIFTVEGTGVVKGPRGREMARHSIRTIVEISPPTPIERSIVGQVELQQALRYGRNRWLETHPVWVRGRPQRDLTLNYLKKVSELEPGSTLDEEDVGDLRLQQMEHDLRPRGGGRRVEHFEDKRDGLSLNGPIVKPVLGRARLSNQTGHIETGGISCWFRYQQADGARCYLLDSGREEFENRVSLYYDRTTNALVGEVADCTLQAYKSTIQAPWQPQVGVWYHIAFTWKSTLDGQLGLYLDGRPVGQHIIVNDGGDALTTVLAGDIDVDTDEIQVNTTAGFPGSGALQIGSEIIHYSAKTATSFEVAKNSATPPVITGRGARGTAAQAHVQDERVIPWGYKVRPQADLYQGNARVVGPHIVSAFSHVEIVIKAAPKFLASGDTTIEVADASQFPASGYALIGHATPGGGWRHEYVYYASKTATALSGVVRGQLGTRPRNMPNQATQVVPVSIEVDQHNQYQAAVANQFFIAIGNEWIRARRKMSRSGKHYFVYDGNHNQVLASCIAGTLVHPRRGVLGTARQDHADAVAVRPVFRGRTINLVGITIYPHGGGDVVTLINQNRNNQREERRITHAAQFATSPTTEVQLYSFETFTTRTYRANNQLTRILKFPTGELPNVILPFYIGGRSPQASQPGGSLVGVLDEYYSETFGQPGPFYLVEPIDAGADSVHLSRISGLSTVAGAIKVGNEIIGYTGIQPDTQGNGGTLTGCVRGYLGSTATPHGGGWPVFNQAQLRLGKLGADLDETSGSLSVSQINNFPTLGFALIDEEIVGYKNKDNGTLNMPIAGSGLGAFRARYGTEADSHSAETLVLWFPTRYPDYYVAGGVDTPFSSHMTEHFAARASVFAGLSWEYESPSKLLEVHALVRVDGQGKWSDDPVVDPEERKPGQLLLFTDVERLGVINRFGDRIEVRFLFHYKEKAYRTQYWKTTPALKNWKLQYVSGNEILHREVGR